MSCILWISCTLLSRVTVVSFPLVFLGNKSYDECRLTRPAVGSQCSQKRKSCRRPCLLRRLEENLASATCKKTRLIAHNLPEHCVVGQHHGMHSFDRAVNANITLSGAEEHWLSHPAVVGFQTGVISALIGGRAVNYAV